MTDRPADEERWRAWIEQACATLDVDPSLVDINEILGLTKRVAHNVERPLAPISAYILGVAVGSASTDLTQVERSELGNRLLAIVPPGD